MSTTGAIRESLVVAHATQDLVRVRRRRNWDNREGYVAGVGAKWLLLAMVDDRARLDGFSAVRLRDVNRIARAKRRDRFVRRALEITGEWPPPNQPSEVGLDRTRDLFTRLADLFPLVSLFHESDDPDVCFVGRVTERRSDGFSLEEISTNAEWDGPEPADWSHWRFRDLSRIDAGGGYETALALVAADKIGSR